MSINDLENGDEIIMFGQGRTGGKFIDEIPVQGSGDGYENLFGSRKRKKSIASWKADETKIWQQYPMNTCADLQRMVDALNIAIQGQQQLILANPTRADYPPKLEVQQSFLTKAKQAQSNLGCVQAQQAQQQAQQSQQTLTDLQTLEQQGVQAAKADLTGISTTASSGVPKNIYIFAAAGIAAVIAVAMLVKKRKK